jgi:hypothetical protein
MVGDVRDMRFEIDRGTQQVRTLAPPCKGGSKDFVPSHT